MKGSFYLKKAFMFIFVSIVLCSCQVSIQKEQPTSTPDKQPQVTPRPTIARLEHERGVTSREQVVRSGRPTQTPTKTPIPTSTQTPTPTVTPNIFPEMVVNNRFEGVKLQSVQRINSLDANIWGTSDGAKITTEKEAVWLEGEPGWKSSIYLLRGFKEGEGITFLIQFSNTAGYKWGFDQGTWQTPNYRSVGIIGSTHPMSQIYKGSQSSGYSYLAGSFVPKANNWYQLLAAVAPGGKFYFLLWDPATPSLQTIYRENLDGDFAGLIWNFGIKANAGTTIGLKEYTEFSFSALR